MKGNVKDKGHLKFRCLVQVGPDLIKVICIAVADGSRTHCIMTQLAII